MSAMPDNVLPFELPKKPRLKLQEPLPDQRKIVVLPFKAVFDKELGAAGVAVLAGLCAFCNRAGITWVSQRRLAGDLGISQPAISRQISKLKKLGYIEVLRKGYANARNETVRVIFDPEITAEEAIAMVSNKEDARPPGLIAAEEERLQKEVDKEGLRRIADMIKESITNRNQVTPKGYNMKKKTKPTAPVDNSSTSVDNIVDNSVDNLNERLHRVISPDNMRLSKDTVFNTISININVMNNEQLKQFSKAEIESKLELLLPAYKAEGIEPTEQALVDGIMHMMATQAKMDAV
jgi:DNA-binding MarR family transcriptional regulator